MLGRESEDLERDFGKRTAITTGALHIRRRNVLSLHMMVMMTMMASAQLRVFSSNNIDICIINPRIPVVETGANGHATALPSTFSPLMLSPRIPNPPPLSLFDVIRQERAGGKGGDFISVFMNCPGPAKGKEEEEEEEEERKREQTQFLWD